MLGVFFTLLYILVAYITPAAIFGPEAGSYHVEEILAVPTILCSIFALGGSGISRMNQTYAALGLTASIVISVALTGWLSGAEAALLGFLPFLLTFFFVAINFKTKRQLQVLVALLFFVAVFAIVQSQLDEKSGLLQGNYFMSMKGKTGEIFYRIRGLGEINDPNDFGQFLLCVIPAMFLFWVKGKAFLNIVRVYIPVAILLCGLFLTHSRGAMLALALTLVAAFRRKIGIVRSLITGGVLIVGLQAAGFTGGRDVSAADGADRMGAWGAGLDMIKAHPIFGVGSGQFRDHYYMTAHNTIVILAAELGVVGLFFWLGIVVPSLRDAWVVSEYGRETTKDKKVDNPAEFNRLPSSAASSPGLADFGFPARNLALEGPNHALQRQTMVASSSTMPLAIPGTPAPSTIKNDYSRFDRPQPGTLEMEEIRRIATLIILSYVGMLAAGWFLSRAHAFSIFIFAGMAEVIFRMARQNGMDVSYLPPSRAFKITAICTVAMVTAVWVILRLTHLLGG